MAAPCPFSTTLCLFASPPTSFETLTDAEVTSFSAGLGFLVQLINYTKITSDGRQIRYSPRLDHISRPLHHLRRLVAPAILQRTRRPRRHTHSPHLNRLRIHKVTSLLCCCRLRLVRGSLHVSLNRLALRMIHSGSFPYRGTFKMGIEDRDVGRYRGSFLE